MRLAAVTLAALAAASACAGATARSEAAGSGLRGVVMRGPTHPVCKAGDSCEEPAVGVVLVFSRAGTGVARAKTGARGAYKARLRPGRYRVTTPRHGPGAGLTPRWARAPAGRFRRVDFHLDTAIR
jgi:hypothetical protein